VKGKKVGLVDDKKRERSREGAGGQEKAPFVIRKSASIRGKRSRQLEEARARSRQRTIYLRILKRGVAVTAGGELKAPGLIRTGRGLLSRGKLWREAAVTRTTGIRITARSWPLPGARSKSRPLRRRKEKKPIVQGSPSIPGEMSLARKKQGIVPLSRHAKGGLPVIKKKRKVLREESLMGGGKKEVLLKRENPNKQTQPK